MREAGAAAVGSPAFASVDADRLRAEHVDRTLRVRLAASFDYLATLTGPDVADALRALSARLPAAAVSPWVFCLYSRLVADLARKQTPGADFAAALTAAGDLPAESGPISIYDPSIAADWWEQYAVLLDTDPGRTFRPVMPSADLAARRSETIARSLATLADCDREQHDELRALLRMPVLAVPASDSRADNFNGASTFFMWGASLINAESSAGPIETLDLLIHESSHLLLFGLVEGKALTSNDAAEGYASPLRSDPRPIDGIFHACFVAARVHAAMTRLLASGRLDDADAAAAARRRAYNGAAAVEGFASLSQHAKPTPRGQAILDVLGAYLAGIA